jgi:hypothetical protein
VSFVASNGQSAPKAVETKEELARPMLGVDLKFDPKIVEIYYRKVKTGLRCAGFVRTQPDVKWPGDLQAPRARCAGAYAGSSASGARERRRIRAYRRSLRPVGARRRADVLGCYCAYRRSV